MNVGPKAIGQRDRSTHSLPGGYQCLNEEEQTQTESLQDEVALSLWM